MDFIFNPRSIAVIGASAQKGKWGYELMKNVIQAKFQGAIYPVNPKGGEIFGMKSYKSVTDIEEEIDLAVIGLPAHLVSKAVKECAEKKVKGALVVTAGFSEIGPQGRALQEELVEVVKKGNIRLVGPNCLGIISRSSNLNASMLPYTTGDLGLITQSGNFSLEMEILAKRAGLGFSKMVSIGNQADIMFHEYLNVLKEDPLTKVIMLYMEAIKNGQAFLQIARETSKKKPIIVLKVGATASGSRATMSHTGSLAGRDVIYDAAFRQAGIIRVNTSHDLLNVSEAFSMLPPMKGKRIVVLTDGGGHAAAGSDAAEKNGLEILPLSVAIQKRLKEVLLPQSNTGNPVDFAGAAENDLWTYIKVMDILLEAKEVDGLLLAGAVFGGYKTVFELDQLEIDVATEMCKLAQKYQKPVVLHSPYPREEVESLKVFRKNGIPVYQSVETAATCLAAQARHSLFLKNSAEIEETPKTQDDILRKAKTVLDKVGKENRSNLIEPEALEILQLYGFPVPKFRLARNVKEAVQARQQVGASVAAKICSPQIVHKSEAGGVMLNLRSPAEIKKAYSEIMQNALMYCSSAKIEGVLISEMLPKGTEVIIGGIRDPQFGPVVMFGLGGIFVEVLKDVSFRVAPIGEREASEMVKEVKGYPVLQGIRGEKPRNIPVILDLIVKVSRLLCDHSDIQEIDLNPVFSYEKGATVADARIILARNAG